MVDEDEQRNLIKAYGLRFIITVTGKAGAFDFIPFFLTIGAGKLLDIQFIKDFLRVYIYIVNIVLHISRNWSFGNTNTCIGLYSIEFHEKEEILFGNQRIWLQKRQI